jgi:cyclophilin family peptidyl-prolyl cis-trans isomerase
MTMGMKKNLLHGICVFLCTIFCTVSCAKKNQPTLVVFETNKGSFTVELNTAKAPISTANMVRYVKEGFYNGTVFHRVIPGFMIQAGGYTQDLEPKPVHDPIKNEANNGLSNKTGTLAMARTSVIDSATSQFFINVSDNTQLDHKGSSAHTYGYAVIGKVVQGMDTVLAIKDTKTVCPSTSSEPCTASLPPGMRDVPEQPVVIEKVFIK